MSRCWGLLFLFLERSPSVGESTVTLPWKGTWSSMVSSTSPRGRAVGLDNFCDFPGSVLIEC